MTALTLRRWSYRLAAVLGLGYAGYVVVMKLSHRVTTGPLGPVGEFTLVLAAVTLFAVGLFADEAIRHAGAHPAAADPAYPKETT
ncbi:MAG: hypothetical protein M3Y32_13700 [Pseudomonadota bacterium]|nr:hypothetical protein [Pseudomonadota bacterium]